MSFVSISSIAERNRGFGRGTGGRVSRPEDSLVFRTSLAKKGGRAQISFVIYSALLKKARFIKGDRLDIVFDPVDKTGLIKRVTEGGYCLSYRGGVPTEKSLEVKMTWYDGMPSIDKAAQLENVVVSEEGILFTFPASASFNGLAVKR